MHGSSTIGGSSAERSKGLKIKGTPNNLKPEELITQMSVGSIPAKALENIKQSIVTQEAEFAKSNEDCGH